MAIWLYVSSHIYHIIHLNSVKTYSPVWLTFFFPLKNIDYVICPKYFWTPLSFIVWTEQHWDIFQNILIKNKYSVSIFHKIQIFCRMWINRELTVVIDLHNMEKNTMEVNGYRQLLGNQHSSKYLLQCSAERKSYRNNLRVVNDDSIFIHGWTVSLFATHSLHMSVRWSLPV